MMLSVKQYGRSSAYFQHKGRPFVSTFKGPDNAGDWADIKVQTGCFFVPDWSSLRAIPAAGAVDGVVDGLFSKYLLKLVPLVGQNC